MTLDEVRPMIFFDKKFFFNKNIGAKLRHFVFLNVKLLFFFWSQAGNFPKKTIFTKLEKKTLKDIMNT
jgi:hypothetical protein